MKGRPAPDSAGDSRRRSARPSPPLVRVLLVDDHELVRQGLRVLLEAEADILVVGQAQDGRRAIELAKRLRPDVVLMDIAMPLLNGIEATRQILDALPATRVLVLSAHGDEEYVERFEALGAAGYLLKESSFEDLAAAIRAAHAGEPYFGPRFPFGGADRRRDRAGESLPTRLSAREAEVLQLIAEGKANKETAAELGISVKTVEKHRHNLMKKLDIHDVAGLTRYAIAIGSIAGRDRSAGS